jgi:hypothetical protein
MRLVKVSVWQLTDQELDVRRQLPTPRSLPVQPLCAV